MVHNRSAGARATYQSSAVRPRCVAIGGGTGLPAVLAGLRSALRAHANAIDSDLRDRLTAIVTMTDDGGSSGWLRRQFDMLPTGDVRNCLAALAPDDSPFPALIQHRFPGAHDLGGHAMGNLLLTALTQLSGDFQTAVGTLSEMMGLEGSVLPSTMENVSLRAEFDGGETRVGETSIAACGTQIRRLSLDRPVRPVPEALRALINADVITVGPGSLYTSIIPNLLIDGIASTMSGVRAVRIYVANLMTEPGETEGYTLADHLDAIRAHVGFNLFDYVLVNSRAVDPSLAAQYARSGSRPVVRDGRCPMGSQPVVVERDLAWQLERGKIRHAPGPLADAILDLARLGRPEVQSDNELARLQEIQVSATSSSGASAAFSLPALEQKSA
jgi:uncharacterized cofD-like protein